MVVAEKSWRKALAAEFESPYFTSLSSFVEESYATGIVYPPQENVFAAFDATPLDKVKVVILGQDPYHNPGEAHGLAFSVKPPSRIPPSLANIYKELENEYGRPFSGRGGDLSGWAEQGVLLLNSVLTVSGGGKALSHQGRGWERFTDAAVRAVASSRRNVVYMLWGAYAQKKAAFVDRTCNLVLESAHPSPLSAYRGFFGCGHFRLCNEYLESRGIWPVEW